VITLRREDEGGLYSVPSMGDELVPCEGGGAIMDVKVRGLLPPVEGGSVDPKLLGECRFSGGVTGLLWQCLQVDELGLLKVGLWSVTKVTHQVLPIVPIAVVSAVDPLH